MSHFPARTSNPISPNTTGGKNMTAFLENIMLTAGNSVWALVILIVGWIIALIIRSVIRALLRRTKIDDRIGRVFTDAGGTKPFDTAYWISQIVYYILLLIVIVAALSQLGLTAVTVPLNTFLSAIWSWIPGLLGAAILLIVAWIIATLVRWLLRTLFARLRLDERLARGANMEEGAPSIGNALAEAAYWLVFLLFLPAILGALGMSGLALPALNLVNQLVGYIPNILAAVLIFLVGWFVARVVRQVVTSFLAAIGADRLGARLGLGAAMGTQNLSSLLGMVVYFLIMLMVLIAALEALNIAAISAPAIAMLSAILAAVPRIVAALVVLVIAYFVGRLVGDLVANLLAGLGFNRVLVWLHLGDEPVEGQRTPSQVVGAIVLVLIMLLAITASAELLGFGSMSVYISAILAFLARIAVALVVFAIGLYLAHLARRAVRAIGGSRANLLANLAWLAIVFFTGALALGQTGISESIVNLAFGLSLGAVAVAAALAFGLGGREIAGRELENMVQAVKRDEPGPGPIVPPAPTSPEPGPVIPPTRMPPENPAF
jgi:hypothetical protein